MEGLEEDDVHQVGRHEVLVPSGYVCFACLVDKVCTHDSSTCSYSMFILWRIEFGNH